MRSTDDIYSTPPPAIPTRRSSNSGVLFLMVALVPAVGWRLHDPAEIGRSLLDVPTAVALVALVVVIEMTRRRLRRRDELAAADAETLDETVQRSARVRAGLPRLGRPRHDEGGLAGGAEKKVGQRVGRLVVDLGGVDRLT